MPLPESTRPGGLSLIHIYPHGQAYGYSFIPKKIKEELEGAGEYYQETGRCLFSDLLAQEKADGRRILFENEFFTVYVLSLIHIFS